MKMMQKNLLLAALGVSLLFNAFVLIGFVQGKAQARRTEAQESVPQENGPLKGVEEELKLDDKQAKLFGELRADFRKQAVQFDERAAKIRQDIANEFKKDSPDNELLRQLFRQRAELDHERRLAQNDRFGEFLRVLTPPQRKMFSRRFGPPPPGRNPGPGGMNPGGMNPGPPPVRLEQFDLNHDGQLDGDEIEAAQREIMNRHQLMMRRNNPGPVGQGGGPNQEMLRRFDANHDGKLDEQERTAMEEFRRTHPPPFPPNAPEGDQPGPGEREPGEPPDGRRLPPDDPGS